MPDNYIVMFPSADKDAVKKIILQSEQTIYQIAEDISCGKRFMSYTSKGVFGKMESRYVNTLFIRCLSMPKDFMLREIALPAVKVRNCVR